MSYVVVRLTMNLSRSNRAALGVEAHDPERTLLQIAATQTARDAGMSEGDGSAGGAFACALHRLFCWPIPPPGPR
jgi:hypothetical protein